MLRNVIAVLVLFTMSCGGGGDEGPTPLSHTLDEAYIVDVPMEQRNAVLQTQNDYNRAKAVRMKAENDYNKMDGLIKVAKNEKSQAKLSEQSAVVKKQEAEQTGDMNKVNAASRNLRVAELERRASEIKIDAMKASKKYKKKFLRYALEDEYNKEAKYELAKAKLARSNNISPKGFSYDAYAQQADKRSKRVQKAKLKADEEKKKADQKKAEWQGKLNEAKKAKGTSSSGTSSN